ncbi:MAG: hypothetical protein ABTQ24_13035 [Azonexus sp.]|jgi:hypothetical protein
MVTNLTCCSLVGAGKVVGQADPAHCRAAACRTGPGASVVTRVKCVLSMSAAIVLIPDTSDSFAGAINA